MTDTPDKTDPTAAPLATPLHDLHVELGGRMVPFAGYLLPVQYRDGILAEHRHTREAASLFDVSHMGQAMLTGDAGPAAILERLVPGDIASLAAGAMRYTMLLNDDGGIIDDLMVTNLPDAAGRQALFLVVNAARKAIDFDLIGRSAAGSGALEVLDRGLIALQGPKAEAELAAIVPGAAGLRFMTTQQFEHDGHEILISRSGYTGEDGFEISLPAAATEAFARRLLASGTVKPAGLGARDSLRLEAGLCLYGNDIDETTTPVEAGLTWAIGKRRREEANFPGADRILREMRDGPSRRRVGLRPEGRAPAREGTEIRKPSGEPVGTVTSGGFGPTVGAPIAMGYVEPGSAEPGTRVELMVRGNAVPATVAALPFVPHAYHRQQRPAKGAGEK